MLEHIKSVKAKKKVLESLNENEREISALKKYLEEKKSSINGQHLDLTNKCEVMQKQYSDLFEKLM